jgi:hypothetical protein
MALTEISYYSILGFPLIAWLGVITLTLFIITALIPVLKKKGIRFIGFEWHSRIALLALLLALIHGFFGLMAYI